MGDLISKNNLVKQLKHHKELFCRNRIEFLGLSKNDKARVDEIDNCIATVINMPSAQPEPCEDAVSREAIESILYELYEVCTNMDELVHCMDDNLKKLPSAQPVAKDINVPVKDCISRREAIDRINKQREHLQPDIYPQDKIGDAAYRICAEFIERLPSVQPEIIHCRDCKHFGTDKYKKLTWCGRKDYGYGWGKNDFCSKAERRTDGV